MRSKTSLNFEAIFRQFVCHSNGIKIVHIASCDRTGKPNSAPKMFIDAQKPNLVYYVDYRFTQTYSNISIDKRASLSFMDLVGFKGYRLTGECGVIPPGEEFERVRSLWDKRLISYEAERIVQRMRGHYTAREAENKLPEDFVLVRFTGLEASVVQPDRVLRALWEKR